MNINASELGNAFVKVCFQLFQDKGHFLYLTAVCLLYLLIRKKEPWKSFWGLYGIFLVLIVFNPLIWHLVAMLGLDDEYYRFLWLIPITPLVSYTGVVLVMRAQKKVYRIVCLGGVLLAIVLCGQTIFSRTWEPIQNIYKIPDEIIEICEIIRADSSEDEPVVASDFDLAVLINQYAPDLDLILSYREVANVRTMEERGDYLDNAEKRLYYVLVAGDEFDYVYTDGYLEYALIEGDVDYIVTQRGNPARYHIESSPCKLIAELEKYCIFRVELEAE